MLRQTVMKTWGIRVLLALAPLVLPATAFATNWVQVSPFDWIDTDSIVRSGNVTAYTSSHGTASPATTGASGRRSGVDCATRREYWEHQGQLFAVTDDDPGFDGYMSASDARYRLLCPNAASSAAPRPAAVRAKPAQSVPPKTTAASDLKICETYNPDSKLQIAACTRIIEGPNPRLADLVSAHHNRCFTRYIAREEADDVLLADCSRAVTLDPKSFDAVQTRGLVNFRVGRLDAAIADFTQAIALNPKATGAYFNRAEVYLRKKDLQKAIADFTAQRNLNPAADEATFRIILCWARVSLNVELETALSDCESAVRLKPKLSYGYEKRGMVRLRMGNLKEARADVGKALSLESKNSWALYTRAIVNAREGKTMASYNDMSAAQKINRFVTKEYADIGLKLMVQAENAPFCPALNALIKAAGERAASKAKADVAMPGATFCTAIDRGYWCTWETGAALAPAKQKAMATAATACLTGYTRKDSAGTTAPEATFTQAKTMVVVGTIYDEQPSSIHAADVAVVIAK